MTKDELIVLLNGMKRTLQEKCENFNFNNEFYLQKISNIKNRFINKKINLDFRTSEDEKIVPILYIEDKNKLLTTDFFNVIYESEKMVGTFECENYENGGIDYSKHIYSISQNISKDKLGFYSFYFENPLEETNPDIFKCSKIKKIVIDLKTSFVIEEVDYTTEDDEYDKLFAKLHKNLNVFMSMALGLFTTTNDIMIKLAQEQEILKLLQNYNETIDLLSSNNITN